MNWSRVSLDELSESIDYGHTASANAISTGPKFLRITDIQDSRVNWGSVPRCECSPKEFDKYFLSQGDIVFARTGATTGKSYLLRNIPERAVFASYLIRVRPRADLVDPGYLSRFFETQDYWGQITKNSSGTAQGGVNASKLKTLSIPFPPLPEQRRIAAILDKADALRVKRREAIARLDQLLQSVFLEMFGDPVTHPKGWPIGLIGDMLESAKYGSSEKADLQGDVPILRMNNLTYSGEMDLADLKYVSSDKAEEKYTVKPGDILFNRTNSKELVGKTAVYDGPVPMAYAGYLVRARTLPEHAPEYISAFLNSTWGKSTLRAMCKNIVGMANINAREFQGIPIPVPPSESQFKFKDAVASIRSRKTVLNKHLAAVDKLFSSLQQQAFAGTL